MLEEFYRREPVLARIQASGFIEDLEALAGYLKARGHRVHALAGYMRGAAHLTWCIESGQVSLDGLSADSLQRFAREHVGPCSCPPPKAADKNFVSVARHLFDVMGTRRGLSPSPAAPADATPLDATLSQFDAHLRDERGLREATRERYLRDLQAALGSRLGHDRVDLPHWTAQDVRDLVAGRACVSLHAVRTLGVALRSFLRFLTLRGEPVSHLEAAIPQVSRSRLAGLPRGLSEEQLSQLLRAIDLFTPIGLRARAIIECLVSLGLRAGEVAELRLADIDWREGTVRVNTHKGRRVDALPLPHTVGRALVAYLKRGRPTTADDHVFVRHYLPVGAPLISHDVQTTVRRAFRHAGLPSMGAHVLRHTTASRLVRAGVGLKHVADVMRHRDIDTTRIYTKVDWPRLAEVAMAWPTVRS